MLVVEGKGRMKLGHVRPSAWYVSTAVICPSAGRPPATTKTAGGALDGRAAKRQRERESGAADGREWNRRKRVGISGVGGSGEEVIRHWESSAEATWLGRFQRGCMDA